MLRRLLVVRHRLLRSPDRRGVPVAPLERLGLGTQHAVVLDNVPKVKHDIRSPQTTAPEPQLILHHVGQRQDLVHGQVGRGFHGRIHDHRQGLQSLDQLEIPCDGQMALQIQHPLDHRQDGPDTEEDTRIGRQAAQGPDARHEALNHTRLVRSFPERLQEQQHGHQHVRAVLRQHEELVRARPRSEEAHEMGQGLGRRHLEQLLKQPIHHLLVRRTRRGSWYRLPRISFVCRPHGIQRQGIG